jgi:hypothetical protein
MYKYIATEHSVDVRHFEIVSNRELNEGEITDAMSLPDINVEGSSEEEQPIRTQNSETIAKLTTTWSHLNIP